MSLSSLTDMFAQGMGRPWYASGDRDAHAQVFAAVRGIRHQQPEEMRRYLEALRLVEDGDACGLSPGASSLALRHRRTDELFGFNAIDVVCSTLLVELLQSRPRPMFLTSGGDYDLRAKAQQANKFVEGVFYETDFYGQVGRDMADDAIKFGKGFAKIYGDPDGEKPKICIERVLPWEIVVDAIDGYHRAPRAIHHVRYIDRGIAMADWPEHAAAIKAAPRPSGDWALPVGSTTDVIVIAESWHLRSGPKADDGRRVVCLENVTLEDEPWEEEWFPFVWFDWEPRTTGFWPRGVPEMAAGIQVTLNKTLRTIDRVHELMSVPTVYVSRQSGVIKSKLDNRLGKVVEYDGQPPTTDVGAGATPALYSWAERLTQMVFERIGISQLAAQSIKPAGLNSGRALRAYLDSGSKRFLDKIRGFERMHVDAANLIVNVARQISKKHAGFEVVYRGKGHIEKIDWNDVDLGDSYVVQCFPTSFLPSNPAGKIAALEEMVASQLIDRETFLRLADFPDLDSERNLLTAPRDLIEKILDKMMATKEYVYPEPMFNLPLCILIGGLTYQRLIVEQEIRDEERLGLLRQWVDDAQFELKKKDAAAMPPPSMPGAIDAAAGAAMMPPEMMAAAMPPALPGMGAPGGALPMMPAA